VEVQNFPAVLVAGHILMTLPVDWVLLNKAMKAVARVLDLLQVLVVAVPVPQEQAPLTPLYLPVPEGQAYLTQLQAHPLVEPVVALVESIAAL